MGRRDFGHNNAVKRKHLVIKPYRIWDVFESSEKMAKKLQSIVDKIEHKENKCEEFLNNNKDNISLSYYTEGYYNGRARALEEVLDILEEELNEEDKIKQP